MKDQSESPSCHKRKRMGFIPGFYRCRNLLVVLLVALGGTTPVSAIRTVLIFASQNASGENNNNDPDAAVTRKQQHDLQKLATQTNGALQVKLYYLTHEEQWIFVQEYCPPAVALWKEWESATHLQNWQTEIYKWCALSSSQSAKGDDANTIKIWIDGQSPILDSSELLKLWKTGGNVAVLDQEQGSNSNEPMVHGSYLQIGNNKNTILPRRMLELLLEEPDMAQLLPVHALLIPKQTHRWIQADGETVDWTFLNLSCRDRKAKTDKHLECAKGYCCSIQSDSATVLMSRHLVLPQQTLPSHQLMPRPLNASERSSDDLFVSTISIQPIDHAGSSDTTLTFYDWLEEQHALPSDGACSKCLREKNGATCHICAKPCASYCKYLCHTTTENLAPPPVVAEWTVTLPQYSRDPERLIPRMVHQTWMEDLVAERYPNMSRMAQSFRKAGWQYHFWSDDDATTFLQTHFPPPVLEAYQALKPGAFKADLFRYCVLLIMGGVYADVDIQLESVLDLSIPPDVGFMVPVDEPGKPVGKQMCVWNGFIAAAPGHPFLAKAIETVVNQVRNRFTSVDVDATFCPDPELSVLHAYDTLFTAGPCLLGASMNRVLGRNGQTSHVPGELHGLWSGDQRELTEQGTSFVLVDDGLMSHRLPGRTIILHQNKWDMGAHRFTFLEQNLVVAATDLPDSNDREHLEGDGGGAAAEHYSKAHAKVGVYGVEHLYVDQKRAGETIRIVIDARMYAKKQATAVM